MRHILFDNAQESYSVAILIKTAALQQKNIQQHYIDPLIAGGACKKDCVAFSLSYQSDGKAPAKLIKSYLNDELLPTLKDLQVKYVYVADGNYFKHLTKQKLENNYGNVLPCVIPGYEDLLIVAGVNYQQLIFNPGVKGKMVTGLNAIIAHASGKYQEVGSGILKNVVYIHRDQVEKAREALSKLHAFDQLSADIEGFSLSMFDSGIATIGFAYSETEAVQIQCDYRSLEAPEEGLYGEYDPCPEMRQVLKEFFQAYKGRIAWHRANHDVKVIIYTLWMMHDLDHDGMLEGLDVMCPGMDDTKVIAYLALNSTSRVEYSLKSLAQEYAGNWAVEVTDIRTVPLDTLMRYNAVDAVCTQWVLNKYSKVMKADEQDVLYRTLMLDSLRMIIHTELHGMPMCPKTLLEVEQELLGYRDEYAGLIASNPNVQTLNQVLQKEAMDKKNATLKTRQYPIEHFRHIVFNPGSPQQMVKLLYDLLGLPVLSYTATNQPETGAKIIKRLLDHVKAEPYKDLLQALVDFSAVDKVLTAFIPAFKNGRMKADGMLYLHGSFNLGGTLSGRLSSSDPNMQNLPSGSKYGKAIKRIFMAAAGMLFGGADFAALEDRINALLTRDPNKIKVYTDGYDGHSLRAYYYWPDKFPDIMATVESINSIQDKYPELRGKSKNPSFLLQYGGSWKGLVKTIGFPEDEAKKIEANYNDLYKVSQDWVKNEVQKATECGYMTLAFGLRLRTPLLGNTIMNLRATPREAANEARSAGNAVSGQSWGLLNNRAAVAFMKRVNASKWRGKIHIVALIHDAIYVVWPDCAEATVFVNNTLCEEMSWQEDPLIQHDQVKIGANLDIFWPNWSKALTLDYPLSEERLREQCTAHAEKLRA